MLFFSRAPGCRSFRAVAIVVIDTLKKQTYYGFRGRAREHGSVICGFSLGCERFC